MGQLADDMVDGTCCSLCGEYFFTKYGELYTHGYPVVCTECWNSFTESERNNHTLADDEAEGQ